MRSFASGYDLDYSGAELSPESNALAHGCNDALAGANDSALSRHGPSAAEDHEVHAVDVYGFLVQFFGRLDALLDCAKSANDCADETHAGKKSSSNRQERARRFKGAAPAQETLKPLNLTFTNEHMLCQLNQKKFWKHCSGTSASKPPLRNTHLMVACCSM